MLNFGAKKFSFVENLWAKLKFSAPIIFCRKFSTVGWNSVGWNSVGRNSVRKVAVSVEKLQLSATPAFFSQDAADRLAYYLSDNLCFAR